LQIALKEGIRGENMPKDDEPTYTDALVEDEAIQAVLG
jgi:hypothetical protein